MPRAAAVSRTADLRPLVRLFFTSVPPAVIEVGARADEQGRRGARAGGGTAAAAVGAAGGYCQPASSAGSARAGAPTREATAVALETRVRGMAVRSFREEVTGPARCRVPR
ncbi:hypothetical protein GCM10010247_09340 [Streptomyces calvus]|nr:hypothetical protein GCM10010247_09340 [Streptomyces calvus]